MNYLPRLEKNLLDSKNSKISYSSAWSILAETEELTVLTPIFWNRKEPEPKFWQNWNPIKNRNRISEPRVPETPIFGNFWLILLKKASKLQ